MVLDSVICSSHPWISCSWSWLDGRDCKVFSGSRSGNGTSQKTRDLVQSHGLCASFPDANRGQAWHICQSFPYFLPS
jgi:hypothetical protein